MRVVIYCRYSPRPGTKEPITMELQEEKCRGYAELYSHDIIQVLKDPSAHGGTLDRPILKEALALLELDQADGILVAKLDRLARSSRGLAELIDTYFKERFTLLSVADQIDTKTATGRLVTNILGSVHQWEREETAERTSAVMKALPYGVVGGAPFGWQRSDDRDQDGRRPLVPVPAEQEALRKMVFLKREGKILTAIVNALNDGAYPTRNGKKWHTTSVWRCLKRLENHAERLGFKEV